MNKKIITISVVFALVAMIAITLLPIGATAQMYYSYNQTAYSGYNAAPRWEKVSSLTIVQGQTGSTVAIATDDNGDALIYDSVQLPAGAAFNPTNHVFSMTPSFTQLGSFPVTLSVTDGKSDPVYVTFYVNVSTDYGHYVYGGGSSYNYFNQAPYFSVTNSHYDVNSGNNLRFTVTAIDPEGAEVRYQISNLPAGASFDAPSHTFGWTPERGQRGTYTLNFYATDGQLTSSPLSVLVVVDGGSAIALPSIQQPIYNYNYDNNYTNTTPNTTYNYYPYGGNYANTTPTTAYNYYPYGGSRPYFVSTPVTTAIANRTYTYQARAMDSNGAAIRYTLTYGPEGAYMNPTTGLLAWTPPANITGSEPVQFTITATDGQTLPVTQNFSVAVSGGQPTVKTVYTQPKTTTVKYVMAPAQTVPTQNVAAYYPNQNNVYVTTGRVVTPINYQYSGAVGGNGNAVTTGNYYSASAYGAFAPLPAPAVSIDVFNVAVRVSQNHEMLVSWDTNKPTSGEVVFGYASQSRGDDLNRTILNYDFTTGEQGQNATRHEISLGKLNLNQTYYLRTISRADNQTEISREIVFIPMTNIDGQIIIDQRDGVAFAAGTLGSFLISGGFLFFLILVIIGLIIYLIVINRRASMRATDTRTMTMEEIPLQIHRSE